MRHLPLAAALALVGCSKLTSHKVVAAVLLESPSVAAQPAGGGMPAIPAVPRVVTAQLYFGDRPDSASGSPSWLSGATVVLKWSGGGAAAGSVPLASFSSGAYQETSTANAALRYVPGATYTFEVTYQGKLYTAVVEAPARPAIVEFSAPNAAVQARAYATFQSQTLTRTCAGPCQDLAFYTVAPLDLGNQKIGDPTCDNFPRDAAGLLSLVVNPDPWKVASYTLQKGGNPDCFPPSLVGKVAALVLVVADKGTTSGNLFISSAVVAGASAAGGTYLQ